MKKNFWNDEISIGYYDELLIKGRSLNQGIQPSWHHLTFLAVSEKVENSTSHLDYACGPGTFIGIYLKNNNSIGVDLAESQIQYAAKKYPNNTFYTLKEFKEININNDFEVITVIGLLEFLSDKEIIELINFLKTLLKQDGKIIFSTPNFKSTMYFFSKLLKFFTSVNYENQWINKKGKKDLTRLLENNNISKFNIEKHVNFGIIFGLLNLNLGTQVSRAISKLCRFRIGWILVVNLSK